MEKVRSLLDSATSSGEYAAVGKLLDRAELEVMPLKFFEFLDWFRLIVVLVFHIEKHKHIILETCIIDAEPRTVRPPFVAVRRSHAGTYVCF